VRWLITGLSGTLAPVLARHAAAHGVNVIGWDRRIDPTEDPRAVAERLDALQPAAIAHLALGPGGWAEAMARWAAAHDRPFLFTSTAMVFDAEPDGPHRVDDPCTARDDYGRHKAEVEQQVRQAHPGAIVARLGWQIDPQAPGNNMVAALNAQQQRDGTIRASTRWKPACSFMDDTAEALFGLLEKPVPGVHHLDANADEGHSFHTIVTALREALQRPWNVDVDDAYVHDQRLVGGPTRLPPLRRRLPGLPHMT